MARVDEIDAVLDRSRVHCSGIYRGNAAVVINATMGKGV